MSASVEVQQAFEPQVIGGEPTDALDMTIAMPLNLDVVESALPLSAIEDPRGKVGEDSNTNDETHDDIAGLDIPQ